MLLSEVDDVNRLVQIFRKVEHREMLWLVNHEEFAQTTDEAASVRIAARLIRSKVQQTPSNLCDRVLARLIPDGDWCWIIIVVERYGATIETNQ